MAVSEALQSHLDTGTTTLARAWAIERNDGAILGFTDHDRDLVFNGITFRADTGMSARALSQTTGLSVDNSAAVGALSLDAITAADIAAGRYDRASLRIWLVNWMVLSERVLLFAGSLGEISNRGGIFEAELRGLAEALNQPLGRVYQRRCSAVLGDDACGFEVTNSGFSVVIAVETVEARRSFGFTGLEAFHARWFECGRLEVLDGSGAGLFGSIKADRQGSDRRIIELWSEIRGQVAVGNRVRLIAGCDKRAETCRSKFGNFLNFRGFPHIPGEDWLASYPARAGVNDGGKLKS